tara:strand:- start:876 stop:983 length:108 start_codon:yes stop_codon:yes gene_type:complete
MKNWLKEFLQDLVGAVCIVALPFILLFLAYGFELY